ncbi:class I SAM-dependent methyltransferase [Rhizobium sp. SL42]|uniref:class I SAM-dependent methyltransferase n=1 Tax=Rhizobium sp. SL42 TaxID=2806346 RepID=UPI001F25573C|nr:class I SAM-dependent methyltransferase [Rhizobium sp. SL42]UJW76413.1 class I SAM-dependent methyltransferase [Rhizobium sp. SL42]
MSFNAYGHQLPYAISKRLFGDRRRFGKLPDVSDPSWQEWLRRDFDFYMANQRTSVGMTVNQSGYRVVSRSDLEGKRVLEIGPGAVEHIQHWAGRPSHWTNYDIRADLLEVAGKRIDEAGVPHDDVLANPDAKKLPFADNSFDAVFTFYALEHIHPLDEHLAEIERVLRPGGQLVGAIPCEGGLAWGMGRMLTSRRWLRKHTSIDPDRLICWEHPNFADLILNQLTARFERQTLSFWPLAVPSIDLNLIASFVFRKPGK